MNASFKKALLAGLALVTAWFIISALTGPIFEAFVAALMAFLVWSALAWYWTRTSK